MALKRIDLRIGRSLLVGFGSALALLPAIVFASLDLSKVSRASGGDATRTLTAQRMPANLHERQERTFAPLRELEESGTIIHAVRADRESQACNQPGYSESFLMAEPMAAQSAA